MIVNLDSLKRMYLFLAVFYYCGFVNFLSRILSGGRGSDLMAENASGSLYKQIIGILLLLVGTYLISKKNHKILLFSFTFEIWICLWTRVANFTFGFLRHNFNPFGFLTKACNNIIYVQNKKHN